VPKGIVILPNVVDIVLLVVIMFLDREPLYKILLSYLHIIE